MSVRPQHRNDNDKLVSEGEDLSTTIRPRRLNFTSNSYHSNTFLNSKYEALHFSQLKGGQCKLTLSYFSVNQLTRYKFQSFE